MRTTPPRGAVLVGSVPLPDAETVFRTIAPALGQRLRRLPDGEIGPRQTWFSWQEARFAACPQLEPAPPEAPLAMQPIGRRQRPTFQLRAGVAPSALRFGPLGYATAGRASYAVFMQLKQEGVIPERCRFQMSLPTPLQPTMAFTTLQAAPLVEPAYEAAMLREVDELVRAIPPDELAIQWDCSWEMAIWEEVRQPPFAEPREGVIARLARLGDHVPAGVELGYHLCYGDAQHIHWKQPADAGKLVAVANAISAALRRAPTWMHLPVPRDRNDAAYFAPLRDLRLPAETELYLGLVHRTDGVAGTQRRIAAAQQVVPAFGVATECGWGRRPPETIPELLRIFAAVSAPLG